VNNNAGSPVKSATQTTPAPQRQQETRVEMPKMQGPPPQLALGRGLDVGTANVLSAVRDDRGSVTVKRERNAFLEIPVENSGNLEMLTRLNVPYVQYRDHFYVLGDASFHLANMFGKEVAGREGRDPDHAVHHRPSPRQAER
jgi:hypothetical protein